MKTQVCIIGAGAGGIGCAYRLIKNGVKVTVVDKNPDFGGTAVFSGVDGWEPGVSLDGLHSLLHDEMCRIENGCHVVEIVPNINIFNRENGDNWSNHSFSERPWGLSLKSDADYSETLKRCTSLRGDAPMRRLQFEPSALSLAVNRIFEEYRENLTALFGHYYVGCTKKSGKIVSVTVSDGKNETEIFADYFVDASGDIVFARDAGCAYTMGTEGFDDYSEPSADEKSDTVNAVTYVFRIAKTEDSEHIDEIPDWAKNTDVSAWKANEMWRTLSCLVEYPNGDFNVNMLPTMQGREYFELGDSAEKICRARVYHYWRYLQEEKGMKGYTLKHIYNVGVRESYRLKGKYVLREQDVRVGLDREPKIGRTIAIGDHALDIHGKGGMCKELTYPYEIPIECTETREFDNLFVACRGASFSHIASSTIRLTRTVMSMGEGVGEYISEKYKG